MMNPSISVDLSPHTLSLNANGAKTKKSKCRETQILKIECGNVDELENFIKHNLQKFLNLFLVEVKVTRRADSDPYQCAQKFKGKSQKLLLKIIFNDSKDEKIYVINHDEISSPSKVIDTDEIKKRANDKCRLDFDDILDILSHLKGSKINEISDKVLRFLELPKNDDTFNYLLNQSLLKFNYFFFRFILLFYCSKVTKEIIRRTLYTQKLEPYEILEKVNIKKCSKINKFNDFLLIAVEAGNYQVLKHFFKKEKLKIKHWKLLIQRSVDKEFFHIFDILKNVQLHNAKDDERENFLVTFSIRYNYACELHKRIKSNEFEDFKSWLEKEEINFTKKKLCYASNDSKQPMSALEFSIECKKFEIYSLLRANGFFTLQPEALREKIRELSDEEKTQISESILKYIKKDPFRAFLSKCNLDSCSGELKFNDIREMLSIIKNDEGIFIFIEFIAQSEAEIIFDFMFESVADIHPISSENVMGLASMRNRRILVGKDISVAHRCGTLIHELAHQTFALLFENGSFPFCRDDKLREKLWNEIYESVKCSKYVDDVEIIKWVFCYEIQHQSMELTVRVPHIRARYADKSEKGKIHEAEKKFSTLFNFYNILVLPDLRIPNALQMINLNNDLLLYNRIAKSFFYPNINSTQSAFDESKKYQIIVSTLPLLTLRKIFMKIDNFTGNFLHKKVKNLFVDLNFLNNSNLLAKMLDKKNPITIFVKIDNFEDISKLDFIKKMGEKIKIVLILNSNRELLKSVEEKISPLNFDKVEEILSWENLSMKSQEDFLNLKIKFESEEMFVKNLSRENLSTESLNLLYQYNGFIIEHKIAGKVENFLERFIVDSNYRNLTQKDIDDYREKKDFLAAAFSRMTDFYDPPKDEKEVKIGESLYGFLARRKNILILADIAGSGKTTIFERAFEVLKDKNWVFLVILRELNGDTKFTNFFDFIKAILDLNDLEILVFRQKYEKNEVKILFDGFDEISETFQENLMKLFVEHRENKKSQFFISTRPFLEEKLTSKLKTKSNKLRSLVDHEQYEYLRRAWSDLSHDQKTIDKCAWILVRKIADFFRNYPHFMGVFIPLKFLAEKLKEKLGINFISEVGKLNMFRVFEGLLENMIYEKSSSDYDVLTLMEEPLQQLGINKFWRVFPTLSLKLLKQLEKSGIISFDQKFRVTFTHETIAEFLVAWYFKKNFTDPNSNYLHLTVTENSQIESFVDFFIKILTFEKFEIVCVFLNDFLGSAEMSEFNPYLKDFTVYFLREIPKIENILSLLKKASKFSNIFVFILWIIKKSDLDLYKNLIKNDSKKFILLAVTGAANYSRFVEFFDEIFDVYETNTIFFTDKPENSSPFLSVITRDKVSVENFNHVWQFPANIEDFFNFNRIENAEINGKMISSDWYRQKARSNFLIYSVQNCEDSRKLDAVMRKAREHLSKEKFNESLILPYDNHNCFVSAHFRPEGQNTFLCIFKHFIETISCNELKAFSNENKSFWIVLSFAKLCNKNLDEEFEELRELWKKIRENVGSVQEIYDTFFKSHGFKNFHMILEKMDENPNDFIEPEFDKGPKTKIKVDTVVRKEIINGILTDVQCYQINILPDLEESENLDSE